MTKIKEILAVRDLSIYDQLLWVADKVLGEPFDPKGGSRRISKSLADLAFQMRDEAKQKHLNCWYSACNILHYWIVYGRISPSSYEVRELSAPLQFHYEAEILKRDSIDWIITALIAKELSGLIG